MCLWETCFGVSSWEVTSEAEMADFNAALSSSVLRNLSDKLYEKRKTAALEVLLLAIPFAIIHASSFIHEETFLSFDTFCGYRIFLVEGICNREGSNSLCCSM